MDLLGHCTWCKQPISGDYVADSDGNREHEWCHGLRMKQERNDAREQLRGAVSRAEEAEAATMRLFGMLSAGKKAMVRDDVLPVLTRARGGQ